MADSNESFHNNSIQPDVPTGNATAGANDTASVTAAARMRQLRRRRMIATLIRRQEHRRRMIAAMRERRRRLAAITQALFPDVQIPDLGLSDDDDN